MRDELTEALLEAHYYAPLCKMFESVFGRQVMRILKPSPRMEAFVGFDYGWARISISTYDFITHLRTAVQSGARDVPQMYFGYFLQYKCVEKVERRSASVPTQIAPPCYRVPLSLKPNKKTKISQHETMVRLSSIRGTEVVYACPMIFGEESLHIESNVDELRIVPVSGAPGGYLSTHKHYIYFQNKDSSDPLWCSEPLQGVSFYAREWAWKAREKAMSPTQLAEFLKNIEANVRSSITPKDLRTQRTCAERYTKHLTIIGFGEPCAPKT